MHQYCILPPPYNEPFYHKPSYNYNYEPPLERVDYPKIDLKSLQPYIKQLRSKTHEIRYIDLKTRDSLNEYPYNEMILPFSGPGTGNEKETTPEAEPTFEPDPYPSRAGWRATFLGEYEPVPVVEPDFYTPKVKIGDYEVVDSDISFDNVGGNEKAKGLLTEIALQFADPEVHTKWDDPIPKGVLFYGQPGTGKTMLAKAFAKEAEAAFVAVPVSALRDKFYGESEKNLEKLFKEAGKHDGPVVIFFDEIDSLLVDRRDIPSSHPDAQLVNAFLQAMDGMKSAKNVMVLGATNYPERLDIAAIRPGRFDRKIEVELPDKTACGEILARQLLAAERRVGRVLVEDELDLKKLSGYLEGGSGADISEIVNRVKNTMARTERAMKKNETNTADSADVRIDFNSEDVDNLLIQTDDIIPVIVNYSRNG